MHLIHVFGGNWRFTRAPQGPSPEFPEDNCTLGGEGSGVVGLKTTNKAFLVGLQRIMSGGVFFNPVEWQRFPSVIRKLMMSVGHRKVDDVSMTLSPLRQFNGFAACLASVLLQV